MALNIKAGTFNILNSTDWYEARRPLILSTIRHMDCDVLGLQEVNFEVNGPDLESLSGYTYIQGENELPITKALFPDFKIDGNAALVRSDLTIENKETMVYDCKNRCALILTLSQGTSKFVFVVTHLEWLDDDLRLAQVTQLLKHLEKFRDVPVVIAGDFNSYPDSKCYAVMTQDFQSAYLMAEGQEPIITFPTGLCSPGISVLRAGAVDYIWTRGPITASNGRIMTEYDSNDMFASDHYAVEVDLRIN
mmetsp:Transcript_10799/g.21140  ORF Transcript_10799/g.21140 Transcript_10799/m.21140 type:complete len:249 (-) Transcript_10799:2518-3264(-)